MCANYSASYIAKYNRKFVQIHKTIKCPCIHISLPRQLIMGHRRLASAAVNFTAPDALRDLLHHLHHSLKSRLSLLAEFVCHMAAILKEHVKVRTLRL